MANKHIDMLNTFFKVMTGNKEHTALVIPDMNKKTVYDIDYKKLKELKKTNLLYDVDNTILKVDDINVEKELISLFNKLKKEGFNICIISNNGDSRVKEPANILKVDYIAEAKKPKEEAFDKGLKILSSKANNTVMIGDQMLSDIKGGKRYGLYTVLVDPLENKYNLQTKVSRILQDKMEKKLEKQNKFTNGKYY